ncbi:MAG: tetratricopeptide repeat protein [Bacteroidales bacterium]|nr:tetratricopeptide repeat protein [Bacteroidales bacterium]
MALIILALLGGCMSQAQGLVEKGIKAEAKGLLETAEGYYRQAADSNVEARARLGMLLEQAEHYGEAAQWLARADSSASVMAHLAACHAELRHWADARTAAEKAVELAEKEQRSVLASAMATLALSACEGNELTNALTWAKRAEAADPQSARAQNAKGIVLFRRGDDNGATQAFRKAMQLDPHNVDACFNLGSLYCYRNKADLAINVLRGGLKEHRQSIKLHYCLGWAFLLKEETEGAIECLERVIALDSGYVNAYNRLGDIYYERGEYRRAVEQYRKAIGKAPDLAEAYRLLGRTYVAMKEYQKAISNYQKATERDRTDGETYRCIAELYAIKKQPTKARANYKRAARLGDKPSQQWCTSNGIEY